MDKTEETNNIKINVIGGENCDNGMKESIIEFAAQMKYALEQIEHTLGNFKSAFRDLLEIIDL